LQAHRLIGVMMHSTAVSDFQHFLAMLGNYSIHPELAEIGRRSLAFAGPSADAYQEVDKLHSDIRAYIEARDSCHRDIQAYIEARDSCHRDIQAYIEARDYFKGECENWERAYRSLQAEHQALNEALASRGSPSFPRRAWSRLVRALTK